jgi:putative NADH-flavin reductase
MSRIVVFGAGGRTGRTPAKLPGAEVVAADIRDPASVEAAVKGQDVVICAIGPSGRRALGLYSDAARALVPALEATGVDRLIAITSAGVRHGDPNFGRVYRVLAGTVMKEAYDDMRLMESIVRESALDWTFVRPTRLQDELPAGDYRVQDGGTPKGGWQVNRTDVACFIVEEVDKHEWSRSAPTLAQ